MSVLLVLALVFAMPFNARAEGLQDSEGFQGPVGPVGPVGPTQNSEITLEYADAWTLAYNATIYQDGVRHVLLIASAVSVHQSYNFADASVSYIAPSILIQEHLYQGNEEIDNLWEETPIDFSEFERLTANDGAVFYEEYKKAMQSRIEEFMAEYGYTIEDFDVVEDPWISGFTYYFDSRGGVYRESAPDLFEASFRQKHMDYYFNIKENNPTEDPTPIYTVVGSDEEGTTAVPAMTYDEGTKDGFTFVVKDTAAAQDVLTKDDLLEVYVDGKLVDPSNYTVSTGCIIITFTQSFMDSLGSGDHSISVGLKDGGKCSVLVSVKKTEESSAADESSKTEESSKAEESSTETSQPAEQPTSTTPKSDATGNNIALELSAFALMIATCGLMIYKKRREN